MGGGLRQAASNNRPNPITKTAVIQNSTTLRFPSFHKMTRWSINSGGLRFLGVMGRTIDFTGLASELQTPKLAKSFGVKTSTDTDDIDACGSLGESGSDPTLGHHYNLFDGVNTGCDKRSAEKQCVGREETIRTMPHNNLALKAKG